MTEPKALDAPERRDLCRSVPFTLTRDAGTGDGFTLDGYAAVFGTATRIDSWEGMFDETVARGAFKKSISERTPVLQFDHGQHQFIGSIPIGRISSLSEDDHGLRVQARLGKSVMVEPVREAIEMGAIDGMSFRFEVVRDEWRTAAGRVVTDPREILDGISGRSQADGVMQRTLLEVKCRELGPVVWPAYETTSVGVRSVTIDLDRIHEPEQQRILARAVWMADAGLAPEPTDEAGNHAQQDDTPRATDTPSAGEHESTPNAEPNRSARLKYDLQRMQIALDQAHRKAINHV